jgi:hypothetical protein
MQSLEWFYKISLEMRKGKDEGGAFLQSTTILE